MKSSLGLLQPKRRGMLMLVVLLALACLLCAPISVGYAADGRDFAGFYDVSNVTDLGDTVPVRLTLSVCLFNYSDADVANAAVTLLGNVNPLDNYGSFSVVSIPVGGSVALSQDVTIPKEEYTFWQNGGSPALWIAYQDASGNDTQRRVELLPGVGQGE